MNKRAFLGLGLLLVLLINACSEKRAEGPPEFEIIEYTKSLEDCPIGDPHCAYVLFVYPEFTAEDSATQKLQHRIMSTMFEEGSKEEVADYLLKEFKAYQALDQDEEIEEIGWYDQRICEEVYANDKVVSYRIRMSSFYGGAHPNSYTYYSSYRITDLQELHLEDLFSEEDLAELLLIAEDQFIEEYELDQGISLNEQGYWFENEVFNFSEQYAFVDRGLLLLYNSYEIGPYAMGVQEICIPWEKFETMIRWEE